MAQARQESDRDRAERAAREEQEVRAESEAKTAHLARMGDPPMEPMSLDAFEGEPTVAMIIPDGGITLTLPGYIQVYIPEGVQQVPKSISEDDYLMQSGAVKVGDQRAA